jgi:hypothetical protein
LIRGITLPDETVNFQKINVPDELLVTHATCVE